MSESNLSRLGDRLERPKRSVSTLSSIPLIHTRFSACCFWMNASRKEREGGQPALSQHQTFCKRLQFFFHPADSSTRRAAHGHRWLAILSIFHLLDLHCFQLPGVDHVVLALDLG